MLDVLKAPFGIQWRHALVRLDRLVPLPATRLISKPPLPVKVRLQSRDKHHISAQLFLPPRDEIPENGFPVHLDFHGGDFIMGSPLEQASFCAMLARELGKVVITVDYRMGPTHRFPAAIHDAEDALSAVLDPASLGGINLHKRIAEAYSLPADTDRVMLDSNRISLSGSSSGGNLALNLAISVSTEDAAWPSRIPTTGNNPLPILLFFPSFDQRQLSHERPLPKHLQPSDDRPAKKSHLKLTKVLAPTYLPAEDRAHPRACPGLVDPKTALHERAHVFLVLAEIDSLRPQGEEWVKKMEECGRGDVLTVERCEGMKHAWTQVPDFALGKEEKREKERVFARAVEFLRSVEKDDGRAETIGDVGA